MRSPFRRPAQWGRVPAILAVYAAQSETARGDEQAQKTALQFVVAAFFDRDADAAVQHFADSIQRGSLQGQEVIEGFRRELGRLPKDRPLGLQEIRFFDGNEVKDLAKEFQSQARGRVDWDLLSQKLQEGVGCLLRFQLEAEADTGLMILVLQEVDGKYKIVYEDDN